MPWVRGSLGTSYYRRPAQGQSAAKFVRRVCDSVTLPTSTGIRAFPTQVVSANITRCAHLLPRDTSRDHSDQSQSLTTRWHLGISISGGQPIRRQSARRVRNSCLASHIRVRREAKWTCADMIACRQRGKMDGGRGERWGVALSGRRGYRPPPVSPKSPPQEAHAHCGPAPAPRLLRQSPPGGAPGPAEAEVAGRIERQLVMGVNAQHVILP